MASNDLYRIPAENMPALQSKFATMANKAKKLGLAPPTLDIVGTETEEIKHDLGFTFTRTFHVCAVRGECPVLDGWRLAAVVTPAPGDLDELLVKCLPGEKVPAKFRKSFRCDHCGAARRRNDTFVVRNVVDKSWKQVGRQCLKDFLGGTSPTAMASMAEMILDAMNEASDAASDRDGYGGRSGEYHIPIGLFLALTAIVIRRIGWVARSQREEGTTPTADCVWDIATRPADKYVAKFIRDHGIEAEDRDVVAAEAALDWARSIAPDVKSEYRYNLGVAARCEVVNYQTCGIVASALVAHDRHLGRQVEAARRVNKPASKHLGAVGERYGFAGLTVTDLRFFDGQWGVRSLIKFIDRDGNVLAWWTGDAGDIEVGHVLDLTATVKSHDEYRGELQTQITRAKVGVLPAVVRRPARAAR